MPIEYRVRPVTRFIVTRFEQQPVVNGACRNGSSVHGEFDREDMAHAVAYALCKAEHDRSGEPPDSPKFIYPKVESDARHA